jgi:TRAP-type mannitol/chloroaromatic compound transport system permease large subunit
VLGDDAIGSAGAVFKAASTAKLKLSLVQEVVPQNAALHCHIVFISKSEVAIYKDIVAALKGQPVLTVSDMENFAEQGGMIGFVSSDNKVKVEVNTKAVTSAGLRVDAQLLEIAVKVIEK